LSGTIVPAAFGPSTRTNKASSVGFGFKPNAAELVKAKRTVTAAATSAPRLTKIDTGFSLSGESQPSGNPRQAALGIRSDA
jgi:hypothetical protein